MAASEEKAARKAEADKAEADKAEMMRLLNAMEDVKQCLNATEATKPLLGLPANIQKCAREEDSESISAIEELTPSPGPSSAQADKAPLPKIPKKTGDWPAQFNVANERTSFVPGWQPNYKGTGLLITMLKTFREKILKNEFFPYWALHKAMTKPKVPVPTAIKSLVDKLVQEEEVYEKDTMRLLDLYIYQAQFFKIYSAMYPQHASSHIDHQLDVFNYNQQGKSLANALDYDDYVREHHISEIGESWYSNEPQFICMGDAKLNQKPRHEIDRQQKKPYQNSNLKHKPQTRPFHKSKPKNVAITH